MDGDADLVLAARAGDQAAFAAIYDRYADRLHDFCHSVLRDRHEAADAMQDAFVLAAQRLGQLRDPGKLRPWLFAIARHEALRRAKSRGRAIPTEDAGAEVATPAPSPEDQVSGRDAAAIVWDAAAGLSDRDRVLLDLHLRQGLDGQELADAIGTTPAHTYVLMTRLRDQVERSLGALLVARLGREDCEALQAILQGWDGTYSPLWRKRVARHVDDCEVCSERRKTFLSPLSLLAAIPLVPAPALLREQTLDRVRDIATVRLAGDWRGGRARHGFPPSMFATRRRRPLLAAVAATVVIVLVAVLATDPFGRGSGRPEVAVRTVGTATSTTVTPVTTTEPPLPPPSTATTHPKAVVPPPPDTTGPALSVSQSVACSNLPSGVNTITATATDPSGVGSVTMSAGGSPSPPASYTPTLSPAGGNTYTGNITWGSPGTYSWTVTATDGTGNASASSGSFVVQTTPC